MDWGHREIEINAIEYRHNHSWLAAQSPGDRAVIEDESAFIRRFGLDWNYVQRIAMILLKRECGLTDRRARLLGRLGALNGTETGAIFRVNSTASKLLNAAIAVLLLCIGIFGAWGIMRLASQPWQAVVQFGVLITTLLIPLGLVSIALRPWYIFQRCEKHRAIVGTAALEANSPDALENSSSGNIAGLPGGRNHTVVEPVASADNSVDSDWKSERKKLLKQIAVLTLGIVERSGNEFKKSDGQPNASQIAEFVQGIIDKREEKEFLSRKGTGKSSLIESIRDGLQLLRQ